MVPGPSTDRLVDGRAEDFLHALQAGNDAAATLHFTPPLREKIPPERLAEVRLALGRAHGPLRSWQVTRRMRGTEGDLREYDLHFERGTVAVGMIFHELTRNIDGLFFTTPPGFAADPTPGVQALVSSIETKVGPDLGATVTVPAGAAAGRGPWPAVVLIPDSGPMDRDGTVGMVRPLRDLAEGLAVRGVVSIRFDKRPFVYPQLFKQGIFTIDDEIMQDAVSATAVVKRQPGVDPSRVFEVGYSVGALVAPEVAVRAGRIAGVIMLAAPGRPLLDVLLDQLRRRHAPSDVIERVVSGRQAVANPKTSPKQFVEGAPVAYWTDLARRDFFDAARRFQGPILLMRGSDDQQVLNEDQEEWIKRLSGRGGFVPETIPGLSHVFIPTSELAAAIARGEGAPGPRVPGVVMDEIAGFVTRARAGADHPAPATTATPAP